jgi:hypothetical protein
MPTRLSPLHRLADAVRAVVKVFARRTRRYRPEKHYMRGGKARPADRRSGPTRTD